MERYKDLNTQLKLAKVFKAVISAGMVAPVFVSVSACEKAKPVVEEAQTTATIPTIIETTSPTTQETAPQTTETTPETTGPIEYKGVMITPIEGLRFDNGTFYFLKGNLYGGEVGTEAGKVIIDAFELNGEMEDSIALRPEIIEVLQMKYLEENRELKFPIPFNLEKDKGITMEVVKNEDANNAKNLNNTRWEDFTVLGVNAPKDTIIYASLKTSLNGQWDGCGFNLYIENVENSYFAGIAVPSYLLEKILYKGSENIHWGNFGIAGQNIELLPPDINKDNLKLAVAGDNRIATDIGSPLFKIINSEQNKGLSNLFRGEFILNVDFDFFKFKDQDGKYILDKELQTGKNIFLKLDEKIFISILPAQ
jgi:hypothetical protein